MSSRWSRNFWVLFLMAPILWSCDSSPGGSDQGGETGTSDLGSEEVAPDLVAIDLWESSPDVEPPGDITEDVPGPIPCRDTHDCQGLLPEGPGGCRQPFCASDGFCRQVPVPNGTPCDDEDPCTLADQCRQGRCAGAPRDCDDDNPCTADRCAADGSCVHEARDGDCDDRNPCTVDDRCVAGACVGGANECGCTEDADCPDDGDRCNGVLRCQGQVCALDPQSVVRCPPAESPCQEAVCDPQSGQCQLRPTREGFPCDDDNACTFGDRCHGGRCEGTSRISCDDGNPCTDDSCDIGKGCVHLWNSAPCDDGNACTDGDVCREGICRGTLTPRCGCKQDADCAALEDGDRCNGRLICREGVCQTDPTTVVSCDSSGLSPCQVSLCDPTTGQCVPTALADGRPCDDGNACTLASECREGRCVEVGPPLSCEDDEVCTEDFCDPLLGCQHRPRSGPCDDGNACTENDQCGAEGQCRPGTIRTCTDGNLCTDDLCDPTLGCVFPFNSLSCEDGNLCTIGDVCVQGRCRPGPQDPCDDGNVCTTDFCDADQGGCVHLANSDPCEDGNWCTVDDVCANRQCQPGAPRVCDDGNPCTRGICSREAQECQFVPDDNASCDDGKACTDDRCIQGECVGIPNCDDGNPCTRDFCDPVTGECTAEAIEASCDDRDPCTVDDACRPDATCQGLPKDCEEGNLCTLDFCDSETGECRHSILVVEDGDLCTVDSCDPETGLVRHDPVDCSNGDLCDGLETCNPQTGLCVSGIPVRCDDGDACNGLETCNPSTGRCQAGLPPDCDDGNECTTNGCDPLTGCFSLVRTGDPCNDGDRCTLEDRCQQDGQCQGRPLECSDGDACNGLELCDPLSGQCVPGSPVQCDNGNVCDGLESCDPITGRCLPGVPLSCDDENRCTDDLCDRISGCYWEFNNDSCEDGLVCTLGDRCEMGDCVSGQAWACDDGISCTFDRCEEPSGCIHEPIDALCDDGNPCTEDLCDLSLGRCRNVARDGQSCDDGNACTVSDTCFGSLCLGVGRSCDDQISCTDDYCDPLSGCHNDPVSERCSDRNPCTDDICDPEQGGCVFLDNEAPCEDGNPCTLQDQCSEGQCEGREPNLCDDGIACTEDVCQDFIGCQHNPVDDLCDDQNPCTLDACDSEGGCVSAPLFDIPCDDEDPCTQRDLCMGGQCIGTDPDPCDDGVDCSVDFCIPGQGCQHIPDDSACEDGYDCTWERCLLTGCIRMPLDSRCDDGNLCTADRCAGAEGGEPGTGCAHDDLSGLDCDDLDPCTGPDLCRNGLCTGDEIDCEDGIECTRDFCDPSSGCEHLPDDQACDDGNECTRDWCTLYGCEQEIDPQVCDDGVECTDDFCDLLVGHCVFFPRHEQCDDGIPCTVDYCNPELGCIHWPTDELCTDDVPCTEDRCDPEYGCRNTPSNDLCDDGIACTLDFCDPFSGGCQNLPMNDFCEDGLICTVDVCAPFMGDPETGCRREIHLEFCDDGNPCTEDLCGAGGPAPLGCSYTNLSDVPCEDGDLCTQGDVCFAGRCLSGEVSCDRIECQNHPCEDGDVCTISSRCLLLGGGYGVCTFGVSDCSRPDCAGYACDDGDPCSVEEVCQPDGTCLPYGRACWDPNCAAHPDCPESDCGDGVDENQDGRTDCWDPSCRFASQCLRPVGWCRLQWPIQIAVPEGVKTEVYGRVWVDGVTNVSGVTDPYPALVAEVGHGPSGTHPLDGGWTWYPANPNSAYGPGSPSYEANNDEYVGLLPAGAPTLGADYAFRFSGDNGSVWLYCDRDARGENRGDGSADGYDPQDAGKMTVWPNLYFSESVEGSSNNKAVEIYNGGTVALDLSLMAIRIFFNGASTPTNVITLPAQQLAPKAVFVVCHASAGTGLLPYCDFLTSLLSFNGDDAVELLYGQSVTLDVIGQIGFDPGTEWGTGLTSTADNTIRRKCDVSRGDPVGSDPFDPGLEWEGFSLDTFDGLGQRGCP